jgi:HEAT repeat protein
MKARRVVLLTLAVAAVGFCLAYLFVSRSRQLDAALHDPNPAVRAAAVRSLDRESETERLLDALKDENADVRILGAMRLGGYYSGRTPQEPEKRALGLIEALKDRHAGVRRCAAESLGELWPASEAALTEALTDSEPRARAGAAFALSQVRDGKVYRKMTPGESKAVLPLLRDLLNDDDPEVRANATRAIDRISPAK